MTWVAIATEDEPSEEVAVRIVARSGGAVGVRLRRNGSGYLRSRMRSFAEMARQAPVLVLADLDHSPCPVGMRDAWCDGIDVPTTLIFRVVVREVESWLMADVEGIASYLGVSPRRVPRNAEELQDAKAAMLALARRGPRAIRDDMLPASGSTALTGFGYNARLVDFARSHWNIDAAAQESASLRSARKALDAAALECECCG